MYKSLFWLVLELSLYSGVLNEEVFESYTALTEPTSNIYKLDITSNGDTLVASSDD